MSSDPPFDPMDIDGGNADPQPPSHPHVPRAATVPPPEQKKTTQRKPIRFGLIL